MKLLKCILSGVVVLAAAGWTSRQPKRLLPTGECWWCGEEVRVGSFFHQGHDRKAESAIVKMRHGGVAQLMIDYGYGPGGADLRAEYEQWEREQNGK